MNLAKFISKRTSLSQSQRLAIQIQNNAPSHEAAITTEAHTTSALIVVNHATSMASLCTCLAMCHGSLRRWRASPLTAVTTPYMSLSALRHCASTAVSLHEAESLLRERFGPQAKLLLSRIPPRHKNNTATRATPKREKEKAVVHDGKGEEEKKGKDALAPVTEVGDEDIIEDEEPVGGSLEHKEGSPPPPTQFTHATHFRASATCRLLGFPVELAATTGANADETLRRVLHEALESDVIFIRPAPTPRGRGRVSSKRNGRHKHSRDGTAPLLSPRQMEFKAIMDELRELCVHFSRVLKFSIKPPRGIGMWSATEESDAQRSGGDAIPTNSNGVGSDGSSNKNHNNKSVSGVEWRCRAYVRDEWGMAPTLSFTGSSQGQSANDALMRCFAMLRDRYRAELESPMIQLESVREVEAFVRPLGKTVEGHCFEEDSVTQESKKGSGNSSDTKHEPGSQQQRRQQDQDHGKGQQEEVDDSNDQVGEGGLDEQYYVLRPTTYTSAVIVEDVDGNITASQVRRQATPLAAYQAASLMALRTEALFAPDATLTDQSLSPTPLLVRMRWQFDAMVRYIAKQRGIRPQEVSTIRINGDASRRNSDENLSSQINENNDESDNGNEQQNLFYTAFFEYNGTILCQRNGMGRYRIEFDCYAHALLHLLREHPDVASRVAGIDARGGTVLFPTTRLLELAVARHDSYSVAANHRGKWNVYALLGTLTSQLIGSFYQTVYNEDRASGESRAILILNDGIRSNQVLIQRQAKRRGEAWRNACLDALRENFPTQYADALLLHPDIDLSNDTMARGSKYRALPRQKRVEHIGNIFSLVAAFAEEDLGWYNLRVRLRNASGELGLPHWVAEMDAQIEGEESRRVVAVSPPYPQSRHARRVLIYQVAEKYFPKELAAYSRLGRDDARNPDLDACRTADAVYRAGTVSFIGQVITLLAEEASAMGPFSWLLELHDGGDNCDERRTHGSTTNTTSGADDGSVEYLLRPFSPRFRAAVLGQGGDLLISERIGAMGESAVAVLCSALRAATNRLGGERGEQLWTEYESHAPPPVNSSRELAVYMFNAFFGISQVSHIDAPAAALAVEPSVMELDARELSTFWFVTLSLPRAGGLAVARAIATSKREGIRDALLLACRNSFPRALHYLAAHSREAGSFATEMLNSPVIEALPDATMRDIRHMLERAESAGPPRPYTLLCRCITRDYKNERWIRVDQTPSSGGGFQCRIYLQKHRRESKKGEVQLVGFGTALSRPQALHVASIAALENLFETDLAEVITRDPNYKDLPVLE